MIRNGARFPVTMAQVFPHGCHLMPDSITEAQDYDEKTKTRSPATDKLTGKSSGTEQGAGSGQTYGTEDAGTTGSATYHH